MEHDPLVEMWFLAGKGDKRRPSLKQVTVERPSSPGGHWRYTVVAIIRDRRAAVTGKGIDMATARKEAARLIEQVYQNDPLLDVADVSPDAI